MKRYKEQEKGEQKKGGGREAGRKKLCLLVTMLALGLLLYPELPAFASGGAADLSNFQPLTVLKTVAGIFLSIIAIIGYIIVGKSVMDIGTGIQNSENAAITSGLKGLAGGGIMAVVPTLMVIFGFVL